MNAHQTMLLNRLRRMIRLSRQYNDDLGENGKLLMRRAVKSTYLDCVEADVVAEANVIATTYDTWLHEQRRKT